MNELKKICEENIATMNTAVNALDEQKFQYIGRAKHVKQYEKELLESREQELAQSLPEDFPHMIDCNESQFSPNPLQSNFGYESPNYAEEEKGSTNTQSILKQHVSSLEQSFVNVQNTVSCYVEELRKLMDCLSEKYSVWSDMNPGAGSRGKNRASSRNLSESESEEAHSEEFLSFAASADFSNEVHGDSK